MEIKIRKAEAGDLERINEIYNYYILNSTCTYQTEPEPIESRMNWFMNRNGKHPVLVAEVNSRVLGWGAISRFKERAAYENTGEVSVYIDSNWLHRGLGRAILIDLTGQAETSGLHTLMAVISADQTPSIKLHEKFGFKTVGRLKEAGYKFGKWLDVVYMQYMVKKGEGNNE